MSMLNVGIAVRDDSLTMPRRWRRKIEKTTPRIGDIVQYQNHGQWNNVLQLRDDEGIDNAIKQAGTNKRFRIVRSHQSPTHGLNTLIVRGENAGRFA